MRSAQTLKGCRFFRILVILILLQENVISRIAYFLRFLIQRKLEMAD
jgi:hypothetical protein